MSRTRDRLAAAALACFAWMDASCATIPRQELLRVDLAPLIDAAARIPTRFAVNVPHAVSLATAGDWTAQGRALRWRYSVDVPGAVSLSFHASDAVLPPSAVLIVRAGATQYRYTATDVHRRQLWSRIAAGSALDLELTVDSRDRGALRLDIDALQAGYRGLGAGVADHPYYAALKRQLKATGATTGCAQNYACAVSNGNQGPAQSTVGIVVRGVDQCTGTLINDVAGDSTPYVLTARHCQNGALGGGDPGAAADINIYWDAVTPCGQTLSTLYDPTVPVQSGAVTVLEQQDLWLIQLDQSPVVSDAYFAGFDASGADVIGGYTVQHALSLKKQYTEWYGKALPVLRSASQLKIKYASNFLEVVNKTGNIGPGASGSAMFDQNNRAVGALTLGRKSSGSSGYEDCPAIALVAPNGSNGDADFTSLSALWNLSTDATSSTGSTTLKSILDPQGTGRRIVSGIAAPPPVNLAASPYTATTDASATLSWDATGAGSCTAGGGTGGDGWSGDFAASGFVVVRDAVAGVINYSLTCRYPDGRIGKSIVAVKWTLPTPRVDISATPPVMWTGVPTKLDWSSNVSTCSIQGGSLSASGLDATGSTTVTEALAGAYSYKITCGSGARQAQSSVSVQYYPPDVALGVNAIDRRLGSVLTLDWSTFADSCTPTGGAPGDGWTDNQYSSGGSVSLFTTVLGTFSYGLTCTAGTVSVHKDVLITVENDPPSATLLSDRVDVRTGDIFNLTWKSNLSACQGRVTPAYSGWNSFGNDPDGAIAYTAFAAGTFTFEMNCNDTAPNAQGVVAAAPPASVVIIVTDPPPSASVTVMPATIQKGGAFTLSWSSNYAQSCIAHDGGADGVAWSAPIAVSGVQSIASTVVGTFVYDIDCTGASGSSAHAQATVTVSAPAAKSGGGGSVDGITLVFAGVLVQLRRRLRPGFGRRRAA